MGRWSYALSVMLMTYSSQSSDAFVPAGKLSRFWTRCFISNFADSLSTNNQEDPENYAGADQSQSTSFESLYSNAAWAQEGQSSDMGDHISSNMGDQNTASEEFYGGGDQFYGGEEQSVPDLDEPKDYGGVKYRMPSWAKPGGADKNWHTKSAEDRDFIAKGGTSEDIQSGEAVHPIQGANYPQQRTQSATSTPVFTTSSSKPPVIPTGLPPPRQESGNLPPPKHSFGGLGAGLFTADEEEIPWWSISKGGNKYADYKKPPALSPEASLISEAITVEAVRDEDEEVLKALQYMDKMAQDVEFQKLSPKEQIAVAAKAVSDEAMIGKPTPMSTEDDIVKVAAALASRLAEEKARRLGPSKEAKIYAVKMGMKKAREAAMIAKQPVKKAPPKPPPPPIPSQLGKERNDVDMEMMMKMAKEMATQMTEHAVKTMAQQQPNNMQPGLPSQSQTSNPAQPPPKPRNPFEKFNARLPGEPEEKRPPSGIPNQVGGGIPNSAQLPNAGVATPPSAIQNQPGGGIPNNAQSSNAVQTTPLTAMQSQAGTGMPSNTQSPNTGATTPPKETQNRSFSGLPNSAQAPNTGAPPSAMQNQTGGGISNNAQSPNPVQKSPPSRMQNQAGGGIPKNSQPSSTIRPTNPTAMQNQAGGGIPLQTTGSPVATIGKENRNGSLDPLSSTNVGRARNPSFPSATTGKAAPFPSPTNQPGALNGEMLNNKSIETPDVSLRNEKAKPGELGTGIPGAFNSGASNAGGEKQPLKQGSFGGNTLKSPFDSTSANGKTDPLNSTKDGSGSLGPSSAQKMSFESGTTQPSKPGSFGSSMSKSPFESPALNGKTQPLSSIENKPSSFPSSTQKNPFETPVKNGKTEPLISFTQKPSTFGSNMLKKPIQTFDKNGKSEPKASASDNPGALGGGMFQKTTESQLSGATEKGEKSTTSFPSSFSSSDHPAKNAMKVAKEKSSSFPGLKKAEGVKQFPSQPGALGGGMFQKTAESRLSGSGETEGGEESATSFPSSFSSIDPAKDTLNLAKEKATGLPDLKKAEGVTQFPSQPGALGGGMLNSETDQRDETKDTPFGAGMMRNPNERLRGETGHSLRPDSQLNLGSEKIKSARAESLESLRMISRKLDPVENSKQVLNGSDARAPRSPRSDTGSVTLDRGSRKRLVGRLASLKSKSSETHDIEDSSSFENDENASNSEKNEDAESNEQSRLKSFGSKAAIVCNIVARAAFHI